MLGLIRRFYFSNRNGLIRGWQTRCTYILSLRHKTKFGWLGTRVSSLSSWTNWNVVSKSSRKRWAFWWYSAACWSNYSGIHQSQLRGGSSRLTYGSWTSQQTLRLLQQEQLWTSLYLPSQLLIICSWYRGIIANFAYLLRYFHQVLAIHWCDASRTEDEQYELDWTYNVRV